MAIHPETQRVIDLKPGIGKTVALKYFEWMSLDKYQEVLVADGVVRLAEMIDREIELQAAVAQLIDEKTGMPVISCCKNCGKTPVWRNTEGEFVLTHDWRDDRWCPERFGGVFTAPTERECIEKWNNRTINNR